MRVLVTGSRDWPEDRRVVIYLSLMTQFRLWKRHRVNDTFIVVHGAARGADQMAADWVEDNREYRDLIKAEPHPAHWFRKCDSGCYHKPRPDGRCPAAGNIRNQEMVDFGADRCFAFPLPDSRGTWDCVSRAKAADIPTYIWDDEKGKFV